MGSQRLENNHTSSKAISKPYGKIVLSLTNCLLPEEKLSPTPSKVDGLDGEIEADLRILGCELIQTAGILLKLPQVAMATGQVLFQRFYYSKSFVRHPMETTAMGCVCLASKIEEAPRRIRDVINVFHHIRQVKNQKTIQPMILDQHYIALKTQVIKAERRVLKELGFCVHVKHPHKIIVMYLQVLGYEKNQSIMQLSWNYMNDALRSDVFVRYDPETVACACIYLSARRLRITLPKVPSWYSLFHVSQAHIEDVCKRILRLYARSKPNSEELEKKVEELRKEYQDARQRARGVVSGNNTPNSGASPVNNVSPKNNHSDKHRSNSRSHSRSRSRSRSPSKHKRSKKHSRGRSRSLDRRSKKSHKTRRSSYTPSPSPPKRSRDKTRYRSRSRTPVRSGSYDKYYSGSDSKKSRVKHRESPTRIRSRH
uniref:Cyclin-like domain-containing protein n=3 Tax=Cuerna arida TaxID=1464854 RepID=A0A1B6GU51_9HEMI